MPQEIKCSGCSEVLYNGKDIEPPLEIMRKFNELCPKCGRQLSFEIENVEIVPLTNSENSTNDDWPKLAFTCEVPISIVALAIKKFELSVERLNRSKN